VATAATHRLEFPEATYVQGGRQGLGRARSAPAQAGRRLGDDGRRELRASASISLHSTQRRPAVERKSRDASNARA